ncbi:unnamed protein product [Hydatigera taeniaeformis]|uniref:Galectin domain-containing protein n=1 Tax=Hydatigena taeniaeformis TaxID=6205 RepID=A0A158REH7_HYDTA|nr:unnamed protein product [Hydatigera taeniaeformis]
MEEYHSEEGASGDPCFYYEIPGGLLDKDVIEITGYFYGEKIVIEVLADKYVQDGENTALPLQFTLTNQGKWTAMTFSQTVSRQIQSGTAVPKENFQIRIIALDSAFEIHLNGNRLCIQKHLVPLPLVTHISIDGEAEFTGVEFKDLCSENDASIRSNTSPLEQNQYVMSPEATPGFTRLSENRRSSNRKPKSPVLVPTRGSFRNQAPTGINLDDGRLSLNNEIDQHPAIKNTVAAEPVRASVDPSFDVFMSNAATPGKRSSLPLSSKRPTGQSSGVGDSKHRSLREKLHFKKGSKTSIPSAVQEENQYATGSLEDVWVEEGGRELSADGTGAFVVTGAASVPNLATHSEKEKRRFSLHHGSRKSRSVSSPPADANMKGEGKDKKKHHLGGIHISKGSRKDSKGEKEGKSEKESKKKLAFGKKHPESHKISDKSGASVGAVLVTEKNATVDYANPEPSPEKAKASLAEIAARKPKTSTPISSHTPSHGSFMGPHAKGSYNLEEAQKSYDVKRGTYHKMHSDAGLAMAGRSISHSSGSRSPGFGHDSGSRSRSASLTSTTSGASLDAGVGMGIAGEESRKKKSKSSKIKGDTPSIAAHLMDSSAKSRTSIENLTHTDPNLDIPLHLASLGGGTMDTSKEEHKRKEKEGKLKGDSAEIADNILGGKRGMSSDYITYIDTHTAVPLKLTQKDLLSTNGKSFGPIIGSRGSYNLETAPDSIAGTYQVRHDADWGNEDLIVQSSIGGVQHSRPPEKDAAVHEPPIMVGTVSAKEKKNLLKGESSEIASNLVDEAHDRVLGNSSVSGIPLCGESGVNVPWKLDATNRNAQPVPYSSVAIGRGHSMSSTSMNSLNAPNRSARASVGADFPVVVAQEDNVVRSAAPVSTDRNLYNSKSSTLPASNGAGFGTSGANVSATLPTTAVVVMRDKDKDKKDKKSHEGDEKARKRDRFSGFFKKIFRKKKRGSASQSDLEETGISEGVGTDYEMTEQRSSSQLSLDTDEYGDTNASITAKPSETCRYASQLHGGIPSLMTSSSTETMCGGQMLTYPLHLTADNVHVGVGRVGASLVSSGPPIPTQRTDSPDSWSSVSLGGSRRHYHHSSRHRAESVSSWSSISPGGTHRHRRRSTTFVSTETKIKQDPLRSSTRDHQISTITVEQQVPAHTAASLHDRDQSYDSYFNITKQESGAVHAAKPRPDSAMSSNSSVPSLYGRVVIVGQSSDFSTRIQSYRKTMEMPKKQKRPKGYGNGSSDSSISSIDSDKLPPSVIKSRNGEYAIFDDAGETVFEKRPRKIEDTYANSMLRLFRYFIMLVRGSM